MDHSNIDHSVVDGFGKEWAAFDQSVLGTDELETMFQAYFAIFPWTSLPRSARGFDLGCGSGRWAALVARRVGELHCIDPSANALAVARRKLDGVSSARFHQASVDAIPLEDGSMDFGYSLGVLHHIPDTQSGLRACVRKLRPGAPFLVYLYYNFDNRPWWFRAIWKTSDIGRRVICHLPFSIKRPICEVIAAFIYWPLARFAKLATLAGLRPDLLPLSAYRDRSFYVMRNDALDRFGTRLEKRFSRASIKAMCEKAGLENVRFSEAVPYWCALGTKKGP